MTNSNGEVIIHYQFGNCHYKGSDVCNSDLIRTDNNEAVILERIEQFIKNKSILEGILNKVNAK